MHGSVLLKLIEVVGHFLFSNVSAHVNIEDCLPCACSCGEDIQLTNSHQEHTSRLRTHRPMANQGLLGTTQLT